jgi:hypothetical protein
MLVRAGADLYHESENPMDAKLPHFAESSFREAVEFLQAEDYWAWSFNETPIAIQGAPRTSFLTAASSTGCLDYVMTAIDVLQLPRSRLCNALTHAAVHGRVEVVSVLLKHGARGRTLTGGSSCYPGDDNKPSHGDMRRWAR